MLWMAYVDFWCSTFILQPPRWSHLLEYLAKQASPVSFRTASCSTCGAQCAMARTGFLSQVSKREIPAILVSFAGPTGPFCANKHLAVTTWIPTYATLQNDMLKQRPSFFNQPLQIAQATNPLRKEVGETRWGNAAQSHQKPMIL